MIEVKKLSFKYSSTTGQILKDISFSIPDGCITGLIGKNGSGKTTLIKFLCGFLKSAKYSEIKIDESCSFNKNYQNQIGLVLSENQLYDSLTGYENIKFYLKLNKVKAYDNEIYNLANMVGINEDLTKLVRNYSFGMQQKLNLIKVLLAKKTFLILDEATSGLDPTTKKEFLYLLKSFVLKNPKNRIVFSTHSLSDLQKICDHLIFLNNGNIIYQGNLNGLFNKYPTRIFEYNLDNTSAKIAIDYLLLEKTLFYSSIGDNYNRIVVFSEKDPDFESKRIDFSKKINRDLELEDVFFIETKDHDN